ncbi:hypothetical protein COCON_G00101040 [Conger conger]|uniref:C2H2-type domain-containing protein n=1 Tax=Conger conger TaxID=82655 RepID=A0A9Q1HZ57_CONCO|nr:hypothetical protein COCON_G00101040 [Conger conger]
MANAVRQNFHSQLRSVVDILAVTAVKEISKLVDDEFAILHLEISRGQKENEALKYELQTMELQIGRGCVEESDLRERLANCHCRGVQPERMDVPKMDAEHPSKHENTPTPSTDMRTECADTEEGRTEWVLIKEERVEEDRGPQGEMNSREEKSVEWRAGSREKRPVQETQNKAANHTEELTEQHRTRRGVWEVSGLEPALKTEPETESAKTLQHTGCEQSTGRLHSSCPEYLTCERTSQLRTFCTQGAGETEADVPSCSYATESSSESLSVHSGLQSLPPPGKGAGSNLSLGPLDVEPEVVMVDSAPSEEEAEMLSAWNEEINSENTPAQHRYYRQERPFNCQHCGKDFAHLSNLKIHRRVHTGEKPYTCTVCQQQFSRSSNLKRHFRVHTREKPFSAGSSLSLGSLDVEPETVMIDSEPSEEQAEMHPAWIEETISEDIPAQHRYYSQERQFCCQECGKRFPHLSNFTIHMRVHTGEKPYTCTVCQQQFSRLSNLKRHFRVHTQEKPFHCTHCDRCFSCSGNLKKHLRIHRD